MSTLIASCLEGCGASQADPEPDPELGRALELALGDARAAWPDLAVDDASFARAIGERLSEPTAAALARLAVRDLYLACALAAGDRRAIAYFHAELVPEVALALRPLGQDASASADVAQEVAVTLLVGDGLRGPRIASYGARGALRAWVRSVAVRLALKQLARERRVGAVGGDDELAALAGVGDDPGLAHLKQRHADALGRALRDAIAALAVRQRVLLRLSYVDGLTVDQLGRMYRVHRATAARWVAAAREALFEETRARVDDAVGADLASVVRLVQSQLDLSLARLLGEADPGG